ncbi:GntR family transcriptional regulator [Agrobacterium sp. T29]|uniref:GntR family transcriptional regulator n=1 Tax=Agrobacterium sp. T29 TaxID=2580515 RepID=UPI00115F52D3|nr:GntR family transcriptional regulator [Agrobacterium sp. T29]
MSVREDQEASSLSELGRPVHSLSVRRSSFSDQIYADLRLALMSGAYEPGHKLNIRRLAIDYNISQTPVREAVMQLVADGALEMQLGHQPRVPILQVADYTEIRDARVPLERLATELSAVRITPEQIEQLQVYHDTYIASQQQKDWKAALAANQAFHFNIYKVAGNKVLLKVIENLWLLSGPFVLYQFPTRHASTSEIHPHMRIIDALRRQSAKEAGDWVISDLMDGSKRLLDNIAAKSTSG